jgi:hypothetical protein
MDLRKHLNRRGFREHSLENPMDIKIVQIEKWVLANAGSFG